MNEFETAATFLKNKDVSEIAELYRHLSGLEKAVSLMGLDPHKLSEFALSEHDGLWRNLALRAMTCGVMNEEGPGAMMLSDFGVSEAGIRAIRARCKQLELSRQTVLSGNFQARQA